MNSLGIVRQPNWKYAIYSPEDQNFIVVDTKAGDIYRQATRGIKVTPKEVEEAFQDADSKPQQWSECCKIIIEIHGEERLKEKMKEAHQEV